MFLSSITQMQIVLLPEIIVSPAKCDCRRNFFVKD